MFSRKKLKIEREKIDKDINCGSFEEPRIVTDEIFKEEEEETKNVEEQMEFNPQTLKKRNRDFKEIAGSFWSAASVFSKKLQKWRQKQKLKKHSAGSAKLTVEKSIERQLRDTQSEITDGRRSCDTDLRFLIDAGRFSLDAGRISFDAARVSFDEPRASWDGCLIGRTVAPPRMSSILSAVEDSPVRNQVHRSDTQILVEESSPPPRAASSVMDEIVPGGTEQTREYYTDSSSRRRKSLDRCSTTKKLSASVMAEIELNLSALNTKVSPPQNRDAKDSISHLNSLRDDYFHESIESSKKGTKKSSRWSWNIFGLLHRKNGNKHEEDRRNDVDRMFSGSWNVEARKGFDAKMMRSNSSVNWRSSGTGGEGLRRNSVDGYLNGNSNGRKIENGILKFHLTPSEERRRGYSNSTGETTYRPVVPASQSLTSFY